MSERHGAPALPTDETAAGFGEGRRAVVVTASTRAAAGTYADRSGPVIVERLRAWGFAVEEPVVVPDGDEVGHALRTALSTGPALLLTTGGTGLTPTDTTPEQTLPLLHRLVPGVAEAIRAAGVAKGVPTAMLFVRNPTGVSHSPAEHAETADCLTGVEALADSLEVLVG